MIKKKFYVAIYDNDYIIASVGITEGLLEAICLVTVEAKKNLQYKASIDGATVIKKDEEYILEAGNGYGWKYTIEYPDGAQEELKYYVIYTMEVNLWNS